VQFGAHGFGAGLEEEHPAQPLGDAFDAEGGVLCFEFDDFAGDGRRQFASARVRSAGFIVQPLLAQMAVAGDPTIQSADRDVQFGADGVAGEALFEEQRNGAAFELEGEPIGGFGPARNPPRGVDVLLLYRLTDFFIMHGNTPFHIGVSTTYPLMLVS
jgi:hypothetical protein